MSEIDRTHERVMRSSYHTGTGCGLGKLSADTLRFGVGTSKFLLVSLLLVGGSVECVVWIGRERRGEDVCDVVWYGGWV